MIEGYYQGRQYQSLSERTCLRSHPYRMSAHFWYILTSPFPLVCKCPLLVDLPMPLTVGHSLTIKTKRKKQRRNISIIYKLLDCYLRSHSKNKETNNRGESYAQTEPCIITFVLTNSL